MVDVWLNYLSNIYIYIQFAKTAFSSHLIFSITWKFGLTCRQQCIYSHQNWVTSSLNYVIFQLLLFFVIEIPIFKGFFTERTLETHLISIFLTSCTIIIISISDIQLCLTYLFLLSIISLFSSCFIIWALFILFHKSTHFWIYDRTFLLWVIHIYYFFR